MNLNAFKTIAWIYGLFFLLSAAVAFVLFKFLPSDAEAGGKLFGMDYKTSGAISGFLISFLVLHFAYKGFLSRFATAQHLCGNVFDEQENPVKDATVSVDAQSLGDTGTDSNGWFQVKVEGQPPWLLRAKKEGYEGGKTTVQSSKIDEPVIIQLKKKLQ